MFNWHWFIHFNEEDAPTVDVFFPSASSPAKSENSPDYKELLKNCYSTY